MADLQQDLLERGYTESRVRVRYAETDQMGVVYHANYLVWFEIGRVDFIRALGLDYATLEREEGALIAVVEARTRYKLPARYDDALTIRTQLNEVRGSIIRFGYTVLRDSDGAELCTGETTHLVVDRDMKRRRIPERYAQRFAEIIRRLPQTPAET